MRKGLVGIGAVQRHVYKRGKGWTYYAGRDPATGRRRQTSKGGVHPKIVSQRLGHSTIAITLDTYSQVVEGMDADAATTVADQIFKVSTKPKKADER